MNTFGCILAVAHFLPSNSFRPATSSPANESVHLIKMHLLSPHHMTTHTAVCSFNEDSTVHFALLNMLCSRHVIVMLESRNEDFKWKVLMCACSISMVRCVNTYYSKMTVFTLAEQSCGGISLAGLMHFLPSRSCTLRRVVKVATCLLDNPFSFEPDDSIHCSQKKIWKIWVDKFCKYT